MSAPAFLARLALVAAAAASAALAWQVGGALRDRWALPAPPVQPLDRPVTRAPDETAAIALFEQARDSVVFISTQTETRDFWRRETRTVPAGTGSGFVWDGRGHVVTNAHVLRGASSAGVRLADGTRYPARLVGTAPQHDLAVLRIDAAGLRPLPQGRSADLRVGQSAFAIGNPFGLDFTLTTGVVSALERELPSENGPGLRGLIQTDAAINPGNSGGPLLDSSGRLIGVNTAIFSPSGSSAGIGFAVPVDTVARVVPQLVRTGRYAPPALGIDVDARVNAMAQRQGITGVLVLGVAPGSPAARAGLRPAQVTRDGRLSPGDVIVGLGGEIVADLADLAAALDAAEPGRETVLRVRRDGRVVDLAVTPEVPRGG